MMSLSKASTRGAARRCCDRLLHSSKIKHIYLYFPPLKWFAPAMTSFVGYAFKSKIFNRNLLVLFISLHFLPPVANSQEKIDSVCISGSFESAVQKMMLDGVNILKMVQFPIQIVGYSPNLKTKIRAFFVNKAEDFLSETSDDGSIFSSDGYACLYTRASKEFILTCGSRNRKIVDKVNLFREDSKYFFVKDNDCWKIKKIVLIYGY